MITRLRQWRLRRACRKAVKLRNKLGIVPSPIPPESAERNPGSNHIATPTWMPQAVEQMYDDHPVLHEIQQTHPLRQRAMTVRQQRDPRLGMRGRRIR